jgi:hypothetical protein
MNAEWMAWRGPHCIGYVRHYFKIRNVEDPLYRKANRALCRYWIKQERLRRRAAAH